MEILNTCCTLLFAALAVYLLASTATRRERSTALAAATEIDPPPSLPFRLTLWALILLFSLLRIYRFGSVPCGFNQDGAMAAVDALALARYGTDRFGTWLPAHFTAWGYGQMSVLLSYCMVPFFWLFGMDAVTARLPMLLWSFGGMAAAYGLLRGLVSRRAALMGLLFLAICPWHFMQSRWALDCNLFPHCFLIGLALLWHSTRRPAALGWSMVFFALCMYSYGVAFIPVPLFLLGACALLRRGRWIRGGQVFLCMLIYFGLSWPIYGTMLINALGWETVELPFVTLPFFPQSVRSGDLIFFSPQPWKQLRVNALALWNAGFYQGPDLPWNAIDGFGTVYRCTWPLGLLGLTLISLRSLRASQPRQRLGYRLLLLFWVCALVTGLCVDRVNVNRINILFYANILAIVIGAHALVQHRAWTGWPLLASSLLLAALFFHSYFGPWSERISGLFYQDFLQAVSCAADRDSDRIAISPDAQYRGSRDVSEILTLFELDIDAQYFQGETDDPITYRERFVYRNIAPEDFAAPRRDTVWVQKRADLPEDLPRGWQKQDMGDYCVLWYDGG
ncbi:MAG: glycosyltransferase family 39 protein [Oscillospiraceae bacterium]|nr:glycosyltransferase family 39 protein [Oscillospiraceae bacterium]